MNNRRVLLAVSLVVAVAVGWGIARYLRGVQGEATPGGAVEKLTLRLLSSPTPVPSFTFHDLDGRAISSESSISSRRCSASSSATLSNSVLFSRG